MIKLSRLVELLSLYISKHGDQEILNLALGTTMLTLVCESIDLELATIKEKLNDNR